MDKRKKTLRPMNVKDLREALKGVPGDMAVEMADTLPVTVAEVIEGVFVISDPEPEEDA
jgi:hypothetical protein